MSEMRALLELEEVTDPGEREAWEYLCRELEAERSLVLEERMADAADTTSA